MASVAPKPPGSAASMESLTENAEHTGRCPCKLLCSQQSQGIVHNNGCPIRIGKMRKTPVEYSKRGQPEICFCFSAASRKPNQIYNISVTGRIICD